MPAGPLFLSYNGVDRASVIAIQRLLEARGISTFLDRDQLVPGLPWPVALEEGLRGARAVAVFIGRELGAWQKREMWFALDRQVREEKQSRPFPVIPVLLAGADLTPGFLFSNTWIDLRSGLEGVSTAEPLDAFERAIKATALKPPVPAAARTAALCPYRGLEAFREEDAAFFAGRTAFARQLLDFTLGKDLVAVVGPSGSGKSSVVQAGLMPLLRHELPPAKTWDAISFTPGSDPFHRLASAMILHLEHDLSETDRLTEARKLGDRLAAGEIKIESVMDRVIEKSNGTGRVILIADQFEELFTLTPEPDRRPFSGALLSALGKASFTLFVTLRADFYSQMINLDRDLSDRLAPAQVNIGALTRDELRESITCPAKLVGLEFQPGLVDRILDDVGSEPGNLPVMEFALTGLWSRRQDRTLTYDAYDEIGGVTGALAQRAEAEYAKFTPEEQTVTRRLFSRLVRVARPEEGAEDTRQRVEIRATDAATEKVAQAFAGPDVRLLVMGRPERHEQAAGHAVEVAHEALIRNWERLRGWLNEDREFLLWRQRLEPSLQWWERDSSNLLSGLALAEAERWLRERTDDLLEKEIELIRASIAKRDQDAANEARQRDHELQMARQLAEESAARARAEEAARVEAEGLAQAEADKKRHTRMLAAVLGLLFVAAAGMAWRAWTSQRRANAALEQVAQGLQAQLASEDAELVVAAMSQLVKNYGLSAEDVVDSTLEAVPKSRTTQHEWFALVALALEKIRRQDELGCQWASEARRDLARSVSAENNIGASPSPWDEQRLNALIRIKPGRFTMGGRVSESGPEHQVTLSAFEIQEHEVTNKEYRRFDPDHDRFAPDNFPVVNVSWYDAMAYAAWLGGSLPTEAQWEFVARGTAGRKYPWGDTPEPTCNRAHFSPIPQDPALLSRSLRLLADATDPSKHASSIPRDLLPGCGTGRPREVKRGADLGKTPEGVYDLAGNVCEWCQDWYGPYSPQDQTDPAGPQVGTVRVVRGGSYASTPENLITFFRASGPPFFRSDQVGFRVVVSPLPADR